MLNSDENTNVIMTFTNIGQKYIMSLWYFIKN